MDNEHARLFTYWQGRNAAATNLACNEGLVRQEIRDASIAALVGMLETFSPARSAGPDWTRSFEPLVERLWAWRDDETMAALAEVFRARGMAWMAVTNALAPEQGALVRANLRRPAWARLPAFTLA